MACRKRRANTNSHVRGARGSAAHGVFSHSWQGAFYAFPSVVGLFGKKTPKGMTLGTAEDVCLYFLEECFVALIPGEVRPIMTLIS